MPGGPVNLDDWDDERLIAGVAGARTDALAALYDHYRRLIFSVALRVLNDESLAEEVTQDVFIQVWKKVSLYHPDQGRLVTWLASLSRNRSIDLLRRRSIRPEGHQMSWADGSSPDLEDPAAVEPEVELRLERQRLIRAIDALPAEQQAVLSLAYFQGMSHQQIAGALGEPLGTVKTRLRLAMQKLRQALERDSVSHP